MKTSTPPKSARPGALITILLTILAISPGPCKATEEPGAYLFAHMMKNDYGRLYYALSTDGLHWKSINNGQRVMKDYRGHPDITLGHDGGFYLLGNPPDRGAIRIWTSTDLIGWSHLRDLIPDMTEFPDYEGPAPWHGAPKLFYDKSTRTYLLTWHFSNAAKLKEKPENYWSGMKTFCVTSPDLSTFSKPRRLFDFDMATIDTIVRKEGSRYVAILKDEKYPDFDWTTGKTIRISTSDNLLGPYSPPGRPISPNFHEAPMLIPRPDNKGWYLYFEQYPGLSYGIATAPTLESRWHNLYAPDYSTPPNARHGCMVALTTSQYQALLTAFPNQ